MPLLIDIVNVEIVAVRSGLCQARRLLKRVAVSAGKLDSGVRLQIYYRKQAFNDLSRQSPIRVPLWTSGEALTWWLRPGMEHG